MRRRRERWWIGPLLAVASCSYFVDTDDLTGNAADGGALDATEDVSAAADATSDATIDDASGSDGSASDGGVDSFTPDCGPNASFTNDPKNCGACGHDCLGGTCTGSKCAPVQIANQQTGTHWVTLDGANVYWTSGTTINKCPKSGCVGSPTVVVSGRTKINQVIVAGGNIYWTECTSQPYGGGAYRCPETGCSGAPTTMADGYCMAALAADVETGVFYFSSFDDMWRCSIDACSMAAATKVAANRFGYIASMTLLDKEPLWLEGQLGLFTCTSPNCLPIGARMVAQSNRNANMPPSVVNGTAYFSYYAGGPAQNFEPSEIGQIASGALVRAPMTQDGGSAEVLTSAHAVTSTAADDTAIRFTDFLGGAILSCPPSGCDAGAASLVVGQGKPYAMTQDEAAIYWANWGDGRVMKLAK